MKHPKLADRERAPLHVVTGIPWSAKAEKNLRFNIRFCWLAIWLVLFAGLLCAAFYLKSGSTAAFVAAAMNFVVFVIQLHRLSEMRDLLGEEMRRLPNGEFYEGSGMLANKPRSTARLTEWRQHPAWEQGFFCECSVFGVGPAPFPYRWEEAKWYPNMVECEQATGPIGEVPAFPAIDPGGGRFVILCSCGLGHYKLLAPNHVAQP